MGGMTVSGAGLRLPGRGSSASGTPAEQAVQRAQKAYAQAVERLRKDAVDRADQDVLKVDQAAVDLSASALAQARAALVREQRQVAQEASADRERRATGGAADGEARAARQDRHRLDDATAAVLTVDTRV